MKFSTFAFELLVGVTMAFAEWYNPMVTDGLPCSPSKACNWVKNYEKQLVDFTYEQITRNCQGGKLQCCYKYENGTCLAIDGYNVSGTCQCVTRRGTLRDMSVELELYPGRGCLNDKECKYEPKICSWSSGCDCKIDHGLSYSGRCEGGRPGKCKCTTQYG